MAKQDSNNDLIIEFFNSLRHFNQSVDEVQFQLLRLETTRDDFENAAEEEREYYILRDEQEVKDLLEKADYVEASHLVMDICRSIRESFNFPKGLLENTVDRNQLMVLVNGAISYIESSPEIMMVNEQRLKNAGLTSLTKVRNNPGIYESVVYDDVFRLLKYLYKYLRSFEMPVYFDQVKEANEELEKLRAELENRKKGNHKDGRKKKSNSTNGQAIYLIERVWGNSLAKLNKDEYIKLLDFITGRSGNDLYNKRSKSTLTDYETDLIDRDFDKIIRTLRK